MVRGNEKKTSVSIVDEVCRLVNKYNLKNDQTIGSDSKCKNRCFPA